MHINIKAKNGISNKIIRIANIKQFDFSTGCNIIVQNTVLLPKTPQYHK